ncbi:hypothetical protein DSECCO2_366430 [anaerobic digester metagenome]
MDFHGQIGHPLVPVRIAAYIYRVNCGGIKGRAAASHQEQTDQKDQKSFSHRTPLSYVFTFKYMLSFHRLFL